MEGDCGVERVSDLDEPLLPWRSPGSDEPCDLELEIWHVQPPTQLPELPLCPPVKYVLHPIARVVEDTVWIGSEDRQVHEILEAEEPLLPMKGSERLQVGFQIQ